LADILIGIPSIRKDERFLKSFHVFFHSMPDKHKISVVWQKDKKLADAQNSIIDNYFEEGFDYVLFLDDDHWGHTYEMLECLINADTYMATIKSYSRHYPYSCSLMKKTGNSYAGIENGHGYQECDLSGFPMTLLRKDLFKKLERPYFRDNYSGSVRGWATDEEFCVRLNSVGIKPIGCFQHCLSHGDITEENVLLKREKERVEKNNEALHYLFNKRKKIMQGV